MQHPTTSGTRHTMLGNISLFSRFNYRVKNIIKMNAPLLYTKCFMSLLKYIASYFSHTMPKTLPIKHVTPYRKCITPNPEHIMPK